jgi:hypothetical protein
VKEPRAARRPNPNKAEPNMQSLKAAIDGQFRLLQLSVAAGVAIIVAVIVGGFFLFHQLGVADRKVGALQRATADLKERIERATVLVGGTTTGVVKLLQEQARTGKSLARIDSTLSPKPAAAPGTAIVLTASELDGLRVFFNLAHKTGVAPKFKLGDKIPAADLKPTPDILAERLVPQIKGTQFLIDRNGALVVTSGADNTVVLIVEPA